MKKRLLIVLTILTLLLVSCYKPLPNNKELAKEYPSLTEKLEEEKDIFPYINIAIQNIDGLSNAIKENSINNYLNKLNKDYRVRFSIYGSAGVKRIDDSDSTKYYRDIKEADSQGDIDVFLSGAGNFEQINEQRLLANRFLFEEDMIIELPEEIIYENDRIPNRDGKTYFLGRMQKQNPIYIEIHDVTPSGVLIGGMDFGFSDDIKNNWSSFLKLMDNATYKSLFSRLDYFSLTNNYFEIGSKLIATDPKTGKVDLFYKLDDYKKMQERFIKWENEGKLADNDERIKYSLNTNIYESINDDNLLVTNKGYAKAYPIYMPYRHSSWYISGRLSISKKSKNKEYAIDFLRLLKEDEKLSNVIRFDNPNVEKGAYTNKSLALLLDTTIYSENKILVEYYKADKGNSIIRGFYFDITPVEDEWNLLIDFQKSDIVVELLSIIANMTSQSNEAINQLDKLLEGSTFDTVMKEYQKQLNEFLKGATR